jgi:hypothetical protein
MKNSFYVVVGFACLILGVYIVIIQLKKLKKREQDNLGFDIQLLAGGIMALVLGVGMIIQNM